MPKKRCKAKTKDGRPCTSPAGESGYCFTHDPARGRERAQARKRGGERRRVPHVADSSAVKTPIRDVPGVMALLDVAAIDTLAQENSAVSVCACLGPTTIGAGESSMVDWISVTEAAREFAYHPDHLRELIRTGKVRARKVVTVWQIDPASLAAHIRKAERLGAKRGPKKRG